jgi:hypothetical protein
MIISKGTIPGLSAGLFYLCGNIKMRTHHKEE